MAGFRDALLSDLKESGLTQKAYAERAEMTQGTLSAFLVTNRQPNMASLSRLCAAHSSLLARFRELWAESPKKWKW